MYNKLRIGKVNILWIVSVIFWNFCTYFGILIGIKQLRGRANHWMCCHKSIDWIKEYFSGNALWFRTSLRVPSYSWHEWIPGDSLLKIRHWMKSGSWRPTEQNQWHFTVEKSQHINVRYEDKLPRQFSRHSCWINKSATTGRG